MNTLKLRHKILEVLYINQEEGVIKSSHAWDVGLTLDEISKTVNSSRSEIKRQLHYLTAKEILHVMNKQNTPKWYLLKVEVYLNRDFLDEAKRKKFENFKRGFSYVTIPLAAVLLGVSLISQLPEVLTLRSLIIGLTLLVLGVVNYFLE